MTEETAPKNVGGRPRKYEGERASILLRVPPEDVAEIDAAAHSAGVSRTDFMHAAIMAAARPKPPKAAKSAKSAKPAAEALPAIASRLDKKAIGRKRA